jgi:uncharacterized protein involved in exopolysaccharide biosynthesis
VSQLIEYKPLLPTRRDLVARIFRQRSIFLGCLLVVIAGFVITGQFRPKYRAEMKILVRKERVDPVVTTGQASTPELQTMTVREEDLNSEAEILKGQDLLLQVVLNAGLVPVGNHDPVSTAKAVRKLQRNLDVSAVSKTDLIAATYESPSPEQSRRVLATLASTSANSEMSAAPTFRFRFLKNRSRSTGARVRRLKRDCSPSRKRQVLCRPIWSAISRCGK